jgi:putative membrane protein
VSIGAPPQPTLADTLEVLGTWRPLSGVGAALGLTAVAYLGAVARVHRLRRARGRGPAGGGWPPLRTASFLGGVAVLAVVLLSGLEARASELLSAHMVQHLALMLVAPPLLLAGAPVTLALRALPSEGRRPLAAALRSRLARQASRPLVAWSLFAAVTLTTHFSPLYDAAVGDPLLHGVEHLLYLGSGLLFWAPLVGTDPLPHRPTPITRLLYVLLAMPPMALVGVALSSSSGIRYPAYLEAAGLVGPALADQRAAGMLMWIGGGAILVAAALAVGWSALLREERREVAREAHGAAPSAAGGSLR